MAAAFVLDEEHIMKLFIFQKDIDKNIAKDVQRNDNKPNKPSVASK